jgi:lipid-A-disaccharide synthase
MARLPTPEPGGEVAGPSPGRAPLIGIVAGEASGDNLGRGLMAALRRRHPGARFVGIGGPGMLAEGLESLVPMDRLSVNGFIDPIRRLPELLGILRLLLARFERERPDVFVGVDFNVFNLLLERRLKDRGIPTVHYVSPSVYAWRRGRVRRIGRAADVLLTLYPFEPAYYADTPLRAVFVGHPLADAIDPESGGAAGRAEARAALGLPDAATVVALLPGSRMSEVRLLGDTLLDAAVLIARRRPGTRFVVPCVRPQIRAWLDRALASRAGLAVSAHDGTARLALTACDGALVKSGTSTLEAMLVGRPMVVCYRLGALTYRLVRALLRSEHVALPNILAGHTLVPELLQDAATPAALADALLGELDKAARQPEYLAEFRRMHLALRRDADARAAEAVAALLQLQSHPAGPRTHAR